MTTTARVYLVGAGSGDPDPLTVKAQRLIKITGIVVYDRLISREIMTLVPKTAWLIPVGKAPGRHMVPQERINEILIEQAQARGVLDDVGGKGLPALILSGELDDFHLSHLDYAGRGDKNRGEDTAHKRTRASMGTLIDRARNRINGGTPLDIVTGNNDADAVYFLRWAEDSACYLGEDEIGVAGADIDRLKFTTFREESHDSAHNFSQ